jgi:hypothetical protein
LPKLSWGRRQPGRTSNRTGVGSAHRWPDCRLPPGGCRLPRSSPRSGACG